MKRALSWLFLTLFLFSVSLTAVSCDRATPPTMSDSVSPTEADSPEEPTEEPTEAPTEEPEEPDDLLVNREYRIVDSLDRFKFFGNRMTTLEDGVTCDFTASGIEFHGFMAGKVLLSLTCDRNTYFTVFINGERVEERMLVTPDTHEIILADLPVAGEIPSVFSSRPSPSGPRPCSTAFLFAELCTKRLRTVSITRISITPTPITEILKRL